MLFNCANGTIDLTTGELIRPRREDLITQCSPVRFDPEAESYEWDRFLDRIFDGRQPLIDYVQRLAGYTVTGLTTEQILPIFYGVGANGKTTLLTVFLEVMGNDYAQKANRDLLMVKQRKEHPAELAALFGKRLIVATESDDGSRLAEGLVKDLTGSEKITARGMYENFWQFGPMHKLFLATNHKPEVRGTDHAMWRRLRLIPFDVVIPDAEQDKKLPDKLRAESSGILAWMVQGCLDWQRQGLGTPDEVMKATATYRTEQDVLATFIADECLVSPACKVKATPLYDAYKNWCDRTGEHEQGQR
jgi:putative DNA primase/helicase